MGWWTDKRRLVQTQCQQPVSASERAWVLCPVPSPPPPCLTQRATLRRLLVEAIWTCEWTVHSSVGQSHLGLPCAHTVTWFQVEELWLLHLQDHVAGAGKLAQVWLAPVFVKFPRTVAVLTRTCVVYDSVYDVLAHLNHLNRDCTALKA